MIVLHIDIVMLAMYTVIWYHCF